MQTATMFSSASPHWNTPEKLVTEIANFFLHGIDLDPCPDVAHSVPARIHAEDGLSIDWRDKSVYCNPPYGREIGKWTQKALDSKYAFEIIMLLPARTDTAWFQPLFVWPICFIKGRLKFSGATNSAPFPSALLYIGVRWNEFRDAFKHWGVVTMGTQEGVSRP